MSESSWASALESVIGASWRAMVSASAGASRSACTSVATCAGPTQPTRQAPPSATSTKVRQAAGSCSVTGATQMTTTPCCQPVSASCTRRARSTGASFSTRTTTAGPLRLSLLPAAPATRPSSCSMTAEHPGPELAVCCTSSGLCGEEVWGTHLSQSQSRADVVEVSAHRTTSAGECAARVWTTSERARPRAASRGPETPMAPSSSGWAVTGTSATTPRPCMRVETSSHASARVRPILGSLISLRLGRTPRPRRYSRKPGSPGRRVHMSGWWAATAWPNCATAGCSCRRTSCSRSSSVSMSSTR